MDNLRISCVVIDEKSPFTKDCATSLCTLSSKIKDACKTVEIKQSETIKYGDSIWANMLRNFMFDGKNETK